MTFLELTRRYDDKVVRINMDHVSEYYNSTLGSPDVEYCVIVYEDGKQLDVIQNATYIDGKIHEIEQWRMNARNRT